MEKLLSELAKFIKETRELNREQPFLSDYENGCKEGANDVLDGLERLINKFSEQDE